MLRVSLSLLLVVLCSPLAAKNLPKFKLTPEWSAKVEQVAPEKPQVAPKKDRKVLVFTLMTGFQHWATPHKAEVVRILGEKTGAYEVVITDDTNYFEANKLAEFDAVVCINNCSKGPDRHVFFDATQDWDTALRLESNLIDFVARGNGIVAIHGSIVMFNKSEEFGEMLGGAFHYHPKQQTVQGTVLEHDHPISKAFRGENLVHYDEPYCFSGAYVNYNFRPLLKMELPDATEEEIEKMFRKSPKGQKRYIAWIKPHEQGRVFYCSPSHNAQSFEDPGLLRFLLNGIQYATGDLECDDTPFYE